MSRIVEFRVVGDGRLWLRFADGLCGEVSLSPDLWGPLGEPLRDPVVFAAVALDEFGALVWPNGFDVAPDALWHQVGERRDGEGRGKELAA